MPPSLFAVPTLQPSLTMLNNRQVFAGVLPRVNTSERGKTGSTRFTLAKPLACAPTSREEISAQRATYQLRRPEGDKSQREPDPRGDYGGRLRHFPCTSLESVCLCNAAWREAFVGVITACCTIPWELLSVCQSFLPLRATDSKHPL
ncbi:hypothetical protein Bbelb_184960 [Branchiostoma belcheri]|nr:hypothetical protein Bbelb_184960 [Branchiostoma belcheri]